MTDTNDPDKDMVHMFASAWVKVEILDVDPVTAEPLSDPIPNTKPEETPQKRFTCDECDYSSIYKGNLKSHKRRHKPQKQFQCDSCEYYTSYKHHLVKHSRKHLGKLFNNRKNHNNNQPKEYSVYKCDKCPFVTKFEGHITRHLAKIHKEVSETALKCDLCDFVTKDKWRLHTHKNKGKKTEAMKCNRCSFETYYMCAFKHHKATHFTEIYDSEKNNEPTVINQDYPLTSDDLDKSPPDKTTNYTMEVMKTQDPDKQFQCEACNYSSKYKAAVQRHFQRQHTNNKPYKCQNCDYSTKTKDKLALHNRRSLNETPIYCSKCKFSSYFKCTYQVHLKSHHDFRCNICDYSCNQSFDMQRHFRIVHDGKGYRCKYCNYKAGRKESLLCHESIHTGFKPYKCSHCDFGAVRRCLLDQHMSRYHPEFSNQVTIVSSNKIESLKVVPAEDASGEITML